jgi:outer membrane protein assembly factor BamB
MTVIELGELGRDGEVPPPGPPVRPDRRTFRRAAIVLIAILTVLGVTGSTPSVQHNVRPLWSTRFTEGDSMAVDHDTLYAAQRNDGGMTLSAYDLATGHVRWAVPSGDSTASPPTAVDGVLIMPETTTDVRIPQPDGTFIVQTSTSSTIARDAGTGRTLWQLPGDVLGSYPGSVLLSETDGKGSLTRLRMAGLRDGVTRWTRPVPGIDIWTIDDDGGRPARIVLGDKSGRLTVLNYADGSVLHTGQLGGRWPQAPGNNVFASLDVIGGRLVVSRADSLTNESTVYRLDDFQELWRSDGFVIDCGVVLCSMEGTGLVGHDPSNGQVRWHRRDLGGVWPARNGHIVGSGTTALGPYQVVDPATGRGLGDAVRGEPTWTGGILTGPALLIGVTSDFRVSSLIQLDLDTGASYLLGALDQVQHFGCQSTPGYLACAHPSDLQVTAVG